MMVADIVLSCLSVWSIQLMRGLDQPSLMQDNGSGMPHTDIPNMLGRVLSGTKYGVKQTRGKVSGCCCLSGRSPLRGLCRLILSVHSHHKGNGF